MSAANNRIRDLDYAEESATQARNSILGDANTAVMAQGKHIRTNCTEAVISDVLSNRFIRPVLFGLMQSQ
jgi:hypothetical protein